MCIVFQIHRDVKPENILIVRSFENKGITAKLADFGTARDLNSVHYTHENGHGGGHVLGLRSYSHDRSSSFLHRPSFGGTSGIGMNRGSSLSPSPSHHHHNASPDSRNHPNHPGISTAGDLTEYVGSRWYVMVLPACLCCNCVLWLLLGSLVLFCL